MLHSVTWSRFGSMVRKCSCTFNLYSTFCLSQNLSSKLTWVTRTLPMIYTSLFHNIYLRLPTGLVWPLAYCLPIINVLLTVVSFSWLHVSPSHSHIKTGVLHNQNSFSLMLLLKCVLLCGALMSPNFPAAGSHSFLLALFHYMLSISNLKA